MPAYFVIEDNAGPAAAASRRSFDVVFASYDDARGLLDFLAVNAGKTMRHGIVRGVNWRAKTEFSTSGDVIVEVSYVPVSAQDP